MSARPYHKRYHSDALAGFMSLTLEERGAYQTLLDLMYDRGGPVLDNERLLAGYMGCSIRKWRQLRETLIQKGKLKVDRDGNLINARVRKELENDAKTHRKLIENGSKGGRARAENEKKGNENSEGDQAALKPPSSLPEARVHIPEEEKKPPSPPEQPRLPADVRSVLEEGGFITPPQDVALLRDWYAAGADLDQDVLPVIRRVRPTLSKPPFKLKVFDGAIREKLAADQREIERLKGVTARYEGRA